MDYVATSQHLDANRLDIAPSHGNNMPILATSNLHMPLAANPLSCDLFPSCLRPPLMSSSEHSRIVKDFASSHLYNATRPYAHSTFPTEFWSLVDQNRHRLSRLHLKLSSPAISAMGHVDDAYQHGGWRWKEVSDEGRSV